MLSFPFFFVFCCEHNFFAKKYIFIKKDLGDFLYHLIIERMELLELKNSQNSPKSFECKICDYECSKKSDFIKHSATRKHARNLAGDENVAAKEFTCETCHKKYKSRNGLWKHNKHCKGAINIGVKDNSEYLTNLVLIEF